MMADLTFCLVVLEPLHADGLRLHVDPSDAGLVDPPVRPLDVDFDPCLDPSENSRQIQFHNYFIMNNFESSAITEFKAWIKQWKYG